jgi:hypothetical protein
MSTMGSFFSAAGLTATFLPSPGFVPQPPFTIHYSYWPAAGKLRYQVK